MQRDWIQRLYLHRNPQNLFRNYKSWAFTNFHNQSDCLLQNKQTNEYKDKARETCLKLVNRFVKIRIRNGCIFRYNKYQFGCGILKVVGPKKQDFWPKINILKGNHCIFRIWGAPVHQKLVLVLDNKVGQKLNLERNGFYKK